MYVEEFIFKTCLQFGMKMMKLEKKRSELLSEMEKKKKAKLPLDGVRGEFFKVNCNDIL